MTTLLGLSGSLRQASFNTMLLQEAARHFAPDTFTLGDLDLPLYNGDVEASGIPAKVQTLSDQINSADAVILSTPEYNKGLSGVMKNALDWVSRTEGTPWADKPVAILSATAGRAGGERAQFSLRLCMVPFRPRILQGPEVLLGQCMSAFDDNGHLKQDSYTKALAALMQGLRAEIT